MASVERRRAKVLAMIEEMRKDPPEDFARNSDYCCCLAAAAVMEHCIDSINEYDTLEEWDEKCVRESIEDTVWEEAPSMEEADDELEEGKDEPATPIFFCPHCDHETTDPGRGGDAGHPADDQWRVSFCSECREVYEYRARGASCSTRKP